MAAAGLWLLWVHSVLTGWLGAVLKLFKLARLSPRLRAREDAESFRALTGPGPADPLPPAEDLPAFLAAEPDAQLPVTRDVYAELAVHASNIISSLKAAVTNAADICALTYMIKKTPFVYGSEQNTGIAVTILVVDMLLLLDSYAPPGRALTLTYDRDAKPTSSSSNPVATGCRPDLLMLAYRFLVLLGEDKRQGHMADALNDIRRKMSGGLRGYGRVPYIIGVAAAGSEVMFVAITRAGAVLPASPTYNMSTTSGRVALLLATCRVYRLLQGIVRSLPQQSPQGMALFMPLTKGSFCTVVRDTRGYTKKITKFQADGAPYPGCTLETLSMAYKLAAAAGSYIVKARAPPKLTRGGSFIVETFDAGLPVQACPDFGEEAMVRRLVRAVCRALAVLHAGGIVHRDVRLPNCTWADNASGRDQSGASEFVLIDLEHAARVNEVPNHGRLLKWGSDTLDGRGRFTFTSDMQLVGRLMEETLVLRPGVALSAAGADLQRQLLAKHLTAEEALAHSWLADPRPAAGRGC